MDRVTPWDNPQQGLLLCREVKALLSHCHLLPLEPHWEPWDWDYLNKPEGTG